MKKKKQSPFSLSVLLSLLLIALVSLTLRVFSRASILHPPGSGLSSLSTPVLIPKFSFSSFVTKKYSQTTLLAVGDIMLGRYCNVQMLKNKDWKYPFLKTVDLTSGADIAFGNLEAPFVENCPSESAGMIFCARPESIEGLKFSGFDILSIANNHILNYGQKGLEQTKELLEKNSILYSPSNPLNSSNSPSNLTIKTTNNLSFGFLSLDLTGSQKFTFTHDREQKSTMELIKSGAKNSDILIVSLHWGNEYQKNPTEAQKNLARQIIGAGAKIIIGHHPHVIQPTETYNNGLIFYSLGNFVFDQPWSEATKQGQVAKIIFEGKNIKSYEIIPIYIRDFCQPQLSQ